MTTDSNSVFMHKNFDGLDSEFVYAGSGAFQYPGGNWKTVLDDILQVKAGKKYKLSFWMNDYSKDAHLRTIVEFVQRDPDTQKVNNYFYTI